MNHAWEPVAETLRTEIAEYGRLIQLFEEQRNLIREADPEGVLGASDAIRGQLGVLEKCRRDREREVEAYAVALARPAPATLRSLLPLMAPEARPLFEALVAELNSLVHRVRKDGRRDRRLQACAVERHPEAARRPRPEAFAKTHAAEGRAAVAALRPASLTSAVG
ncbi:MAG: flagellar export chaperone FlgN [Opitutaceae bacterium]|jgi:hypothetical protein